MKCWLSREERPRRAASGMRTGKDFRLLSCLFSWKERNSFNFFFHNYNWWGAISSKLYLYKQYLPFSYSMMEITKIYLFYFILALDVSSIHIFFLLLKTTAARNLHSPRKNRRPSPRNFITRRIISILHWPQLPPFPPNIKLNSSSFFSLSLARNTAANLQL